jgi:cytoskeleton protein RodZ
MSAFGERLRREREMRGVSLDDIAEATKIGTRLLRALEDEHFELLPGGIFNKGFVRAYAKYLGLNEDEMVADYLQAAGESSPDPRVIAEQNSSRIDRGDSDYGESNMAGFPIIPVLILLVVIAAGAGGWHIYQDRIKMRHAASDVAQTTAAAPPVSATPSTSNPATPAGETAQSQQPASGPAAPSSLPATSAATTGQPNGQASTPADLNKAAKPNEPAAATGAGTATAIDATKPAAPVANRPAATTAATSTETGQPFEVAVRAKDRAWVSIKSDGKYAVQGIISPPDVKTVRATGQVIFYTGNAGAVEISFNGQLIPLPGGPNEKGVLVFNSHGVVVPKPTSASQEQ